MDVQLRRHRKVQNDENQENVYAKGKSIVLPTKKQGLGLRGALGDLNTNVLTQRDINIGKVAGAAAELEKKAALCRGAVKSNYSHVQSKVDTGLPTKVITQISARPPLRREESTASHAVRAMVRTRAVIKEAIKTTETKESSVSICLQTKKTESKKAGKLSSVKEEKQIKSLKPILKESTESLGKLKIEENSTISNKSSTKSVYRSPLYSNVDTPKLPANIEDIDAGDDNPLIMSIYIKDIYRYLIQLEEKYSVEPDYLKKQTEITGKMRATLIDWLVDVHHQFTLIQETFHLTVGIIDRYLQVVPITRSQLQLVGVTAMFIASKYEEIYAPEIGDFVYVTDKAYSKADIFQCERDIMSKLGFCLARPIPLSFLRRFVKAARGTTKNHHLAKYLVDLSLVEYSMAHFRPSQLAAAAICLSLHLLSHQSLEEVWTPTLSYYSGYTLDQIEPIITKIAKLVISVEDSKHKAVYKKYQDRSLAKVASLPHLKSDIIYKLARVSLPTPDN